MAGVWPEVRLSARRHVDQIVVPSYAEPAVRVPDQGVLAFGSLAAGNYTLYFPSVARFAFRPPSLDVEVSRAPSTTDEVIEDLFRTTVYPLVLHVLGYEALHASAVETGAGVIAFCGVSGSGKSTLAYLLGRRWAPWADDVVIFQADDAGVIARRLPQRAQLREPARRVLLAAGAAPKHVGGVAGDASPLRALLVLVPGSAGATEARRLVPADALEHVLPHGLRFTLLDEDVRRRTVAHYLELVSTTPVFELRFRHDVGRLSRLADEVAGIVEEIQPL